MSYTKATQRKYNFIMGATRLERKKALQRINSGQNKNIPVECKDCNDHIVFLQHSHNSHTHNNNDTNNTNYSNNHTHVTHTHTNHNHTSSNHANSQNHYHHRNLNNTTRLSHGASLQNGNYHTTGCSKCRLYDYQRCSHNFNYDLEPYYPHKHSNAHGHIHNHDSDSDHHLDHHSDEHSHDHTNNHTHTVSDHTQTVADHTNNHTHTVSDHTQTVADHTHTLPEHSHHIITEDLHNNFRVGTNSLKNVSSGDSNTAVGINAGESITQGSDNVIIGKNADTSAVNSNNEIVIGTDATGVHSNVAVIGNEEITKLYGGSDGGATIFAYEHIQGSDSRIKENVEDLGECLPFINSLRPVVYEKVKPIDYPDELRNKIYPNNKPRTMTDEEKSKNNLGFIAQEVEISKNNNLSQSVDNMVNVNLDTGLYTLSYDKFVVPLVKAIQELKQETDNKINALSKRIKK